MKKYKKIYIFLVISTSFLFSPTLLANKVQCPQTLHCKTTNPKSCLTDDEWRIISGSFQASDTTLDLKAINLAATTNTLNLTCTYVRKYPGKEEAGLAIDRQDINRQETDALKEWEMKDGYYKCKNGLTCHVVTTK